MYPKYKKFHEKFWVKYEKDPSIKDTMLEFNISKNDAFDLVYGMQEIIYLKDTFNKSYFYSNDETKSNKANLTINNTKHNTEKEAIDNIMTIEAMDLITDKQRAAIKLYYFKDLNKTEISKQLGCSISMVSKYLSTALRNIKKSEKFYCGSFEN